MPAKTIRIFMPDGTPTGLKTAEIGLSTVKAVACPRAGLDQFAKRPESRRTGVYVLIGPDSAIPGRLATYFGEGDDVLDRLVIHNKDATKDFFERVLVFVSKDDNLTKAHVRWLEARFVELARSANRATVTNSTNPIGGSLPETDATEMQEFLEQALLLAATMGLSIFDAMPAAPAVTGTLLVQTITLKGEGYSARANLVDGEIVVLKGSIARAHEAQSLNNYSRALRAELLASNVLSQNDIGLLFNQDYPFGSPSGAAQVVYGASVNGWDVWKFEDGSPLSTIREALASTASTETVV